MRSNLPGGVLSPCLLIQFVLCCFCCYNTITIVNGAPIHDSSLALQQSQSKSNGGGIELDEKSSDSFDQTKQWHSHALRYLREFGYLTTARPTPREFENAVRALQDLIGAEITGQLDSATMSFMLQPRCGNGDISGGRERRKRFVYIARWESKVRDNVLLLKWYIQNYTEDIPQAEIRRIAHKAFEIWSSQVKINAMESLTLVTSEAEADITILWAEGDHGDAHKFDGPGTDGSNTLAHTFYPNYQSPQHPLSRINGDVHFDDYEKWNVNSSKDGASFFHVLVHEIGHTLGLGHSKKQKAIMFPIYRKENLDLTQLDLDDKCAINWSYVGASDLCLYIWLLSEVLPKKIAIERDVLVAAAAYRTEPEQLSSGTQQPNYHQLKVPVCREGNAVRVHLENMLHRRLSFPRHLSHDYSEVLCRFFDAFQQQYELNGTEDFHEVFRLHGVHNYFQDDDDRFAMLEVQLPAHQQRHFDADFFRWILAEFNK